MKITALTLQGVRGWPDLDIPAISPALSCYYGPPGSGKSTAADFLAHVLYGKPPLRTAPATTEHIAPHGGTIVTTSSGRYRLRRCHDGASALRLTVASLDDRPVDGHTVRSMLGRLSPAVLSRLFAVSFDEPPSIAALLSVELAQEFRALVGDGAFENNRRWKELVARRDELARELETRIAAERRASGDLDEQSRQLDDAIREALPAAQALDERLRSVEAALAETDARLRYRRMELNVELRWSAAESEDHEPQLAELDGEIARWRAVLAELSAREAGLRARLSQVRPSDGEAVANLANQRTWTDVARQLAADLEGEVARLARAAASQQCACRDAHPRLRPIVETLQRQLDVLDSLVIGHQQAAQAAKLRDEADHLARSQAELRRQLEHLLDRRQSLSRGSKPSRPPSDDSSAGLTAADAEQLEQRRLELEQERFDLVRQVQSQQRRLKELRSRRARVDRERAAVLSARSIEHVQRELADVQRKLEHTTGSGEEEDATVSPVASPRASDYLAQLTGGRLIALQLVEGGRSAVVVNRAGETVPLKSLRPGERDLLYLSLSLALVAAAARHGVRLPLVLDEPFARLDAGDTAALAAVLDHFSRQGHQILAFTAHRAAADRLASLGAEVNDLLSLRRREQQPVVVSSKNTDRATPTAKSPKTRAADGGKRKLRRRKDSPSSPGQSDAA